MPDYQKGKIYKLWSPQGTEEEVYFGSTCNELYKRKNQHKYNNECRSKILFKKYDDIRIEVIEEYPCNSKAELLKKEGEYIRNNKCLNKHIPDRTHKEWREDNKEKLTEYKKEYNKEKLTCDCGCIFRKDGLIRHQKSSKHIKLMEKIKNNI